MPNQGRDTNATSLGNTLRSAEFAVWREPNESLCRTKSAHDGVSVCQTSQQLTDRVMRHSKHEKLTPEMLFTIDEVCNYVRDCWRHPTREELPVLEPTRTVFGEMCVARTLRGFS